MNKNSGDDTSAFIDTAYRELGPAELLKAPVSALRGVSEGDARVLRASLGIRTIGDLARHWAVERADGIRRAAADDEPHPPLTLAPRAVTSAAAWEATPYSRAAQALCGIPIDALAQDDPQTGCPVLASAVAVRGLALRWSTLPVLTGDEPLVVACDELTIDRAVTLGRFACIFARRIVVGVAEGLIIDATEDSGAGLELYTQEIVDGQGQPCALPVHRVKDADTDEAYTLALATPFDLVGVRLDGEGWAPIEACDPAYLNEGEAPRALLYDQLQLAATLSSARRDLALAIDRWVAALTAQRQDLAGVETAARTGAAQLLLAAGAPDSAILVPPLDLDVYRADLDAWVEVLASRLELWARLDDRTRSDAQWLADAKTQVASFSIAADLAQQLREKAEKEKQKVQGAWSQAVRVVSLRKQELDRVKSEFDGAVEIWKDRKTREGVFALLKDAAMFVVEIAKLAVELVAAPEVAAPDAAKVASDVTSAGMEAVVAIASTFSETTSMRTDPDGSTTTTSTTTVSKRGLVALRTTGAGGRGSSPPSASTTLALTAGPKRPLSAREQAAGWMESDGFKTAKQKAGVVAKHGEALATGAAAIVGDIQNLASIGPRATALHRQSTQVVDQMDKGLGETFASTELEGLDVVTGGRQVWDGLEQHTDEFFRSCPQIEAEIVPEGAALHAAVRSLVLAARVLCETRIAVSKAQGAWVEARLREQTARQVQQVWSGRAADLASALKQDAAQRRLAGERLRDARLAICALADEYRRAWMYFTLVEPDRAPASLTPAAPIDDVRASVGVLTSRERLFGNLRPTPQRLTLQFTAPLQPCSSVSTTDDPHGLTASFEIAADHGSFLGLSRVRVDRWRLYLDDAIAVPDGAIVTVQFQSDPVYVDRLRVGVRQFAADPFALTFSYTQQAGGARLIRLDGELPLRFSESFRKPTPFTRWYVRISIQDAQHGPLDCRALGIVSLGLDLEGEASPL